MGHSPLIIYYENFQPIYARSFQTKWARSVPNCMKVQVSSHAKLSLPLVDVPVNYNSRSRKFYLFDSSDSTCERGMDLDASISGASLISQFVGKICRLVLSIRTHSYHIREA